MKIASVFVLVLGLFLVSQPSFAARERLNVRGSAVINLRDCGGTLRVTETARAGDVRIELNDVRNCSRIDVTSGNTNYEVKLEPRFRGDENGPREGTFAVPASHFRYGAVEISVHSKSGKTSDTVVVTLEREPEPRRYNEVSLTLGETAYLRSCGGTVSVTVSENGNSDQVNLVFRNVETCSNFDIVSSTGRQVGYEGKKLQGQPGRYNGSFTIPKRMVKGLFESFLGYNAVKIRVNSNSGKHGDEVTVRFFNW